MSEDNKTHVVSQPNKQVAPATPLDSLKLTMEKELRKQVVNYFNGREEEALKFMTAAVDYVRKTPKLLNCDRTSLLTAFIQSAQFRFMPSGTSGEAYIIPYKDEAHFQLGYQGIVTLLYRTEKVVGITANIIYQHDQFDYQEGLEAHLIHKPAMFGKKKGEPIGAYTIALMKDGSKTFKVMDEAAIMEIKALSKARDSKESPWNSDKDPELWMWKKTCLIQHAKLLPKTEELQKAIEIDYDGEGINKPRLDAGGSAVGASFHDPANLPDPTRCPSGDHSKDFVVEGKCIKCEEKKEMEKIGDSVK